MIDGFLKAGGNRKVVFAMGDAPKTGGDPAQVIRNPSQVTVQPLRTESVAVPAGRFDTVVLNTRTVSRPRIQSIDSIDVDATGWFAPKLGYPVKIAIRQTIAGKHQQKVSQIYLAAKIDRESAPKDGCNDVPVK